MRKRWFWVILGAGVLAVGVLAVATREREPEYGGRKLSEWAKMYAEGLGNGTRSDETRQAGEAICQIGTNAVPYLVKWSTYQVPRWKLSLELWFIQIVGKVNWKWMVSFRDRKTDRSGHAFYAMMAPDNETVDASGGLKNWTPTRQTVWREYGTTHRMQLGFEIGLMRTNDPSRVQFVEGLLTDPNFEVRRVATNALRRIRDDTNLTGVHR